VYASRVSSLFLLLTLCSIIKIGNGINIKEIDKILETRPLSNPKQGDGTALGFVSISRLTETNERLPLSPPTNKESVLCSECLIFSDSLFILSSDLTLLSSLQHLNLNCEQICTQSSLLLSLPSTIQTSCLSVCSTLTPTKFFTSLSSSTVPPPLDFCNANNLCLTKPSSGSPLTGPTTVTIESLTINPRSGPVNTIFNITMTYNVTSGSIPSGEVEFLTFTPEGRVPNQGESIVIIDQSGGRYETGFKLSTAVSEAESWPVGKYTVYSAVCLGACRSYGDILAQKTEEFVINGPVSNVLKKK